MAWRGISMNRRGFIQSFIGAAAMAAMPNVKKPTLLHDAAHHDLTRGFGLVQAKAEGTIIPYDPGVRLFSAKHPKALKDGLNKMFDGDLDLDNLEELWIDVDVDDEDEEA